MDAKYIYLLSKIKDKETRMLITEMAKDIAELKEENRKLKPPQINAVGKSMESIDRMRIKDGPWMHQIVD